MIATTTVGPFEENEFLFQIFHMRWNGRILRICSNAKVCSFLREINPNFSVCSVGSDAYVELYDGPDGKPTGTGVLEYRRIEDAQKCVDVMHRRDCKGRNLVCREVRFFCWIYLFNQTNIKLFKITVIFKNIFQFKKNNFFKNWKKILAPRKNY